MVALKIHIYIVHNLLNHTMSNINVIDNYVITVVLSQ